MRSRSALGAVLLVVAAALTTALAAPAVSAAPVAACGPVGPFECASSKRQTFGDITLEAAFTDRWDGVGVRTWTVRPTATGAVVGGNGSVPVQIVETFCASKYAFNVSFTGPFLAPTTDDNCAQRTGTGTGRASNEGDVVARSSPLGRWIYLQHRVEVRATVNGRNLFVTTERRMGPNGGDV